MITLKTQEMDDVWVVTFKVDKILDEQVIQQVGEDLGELAGKAGEGQKLVLTFRGVGFMSSAMLGKLIMFNKKCKQGGVNLKVCSISPEILEVFKITKLDKLFDVKKDEQQALKSFTKKGWFG